MQEETLQWEDDLEADSSAGESTSTAGSTRKLTCRWDLCGMTFDLLDSLVGHLNKMHARASSNGLFHCKWRGCTRNGKGFNARYKMLVHVRTHTNEKPHQCPKCNKCFSRAENLKIHARSHTGEKPYICPVDGCGKAYSNSSDRFKHTRTHYVEKPYACKVAGCSKRYTDPSSLRKHIKTYRHFQGGHDNSDDINDLDLEDDSDVVTPKIEPQDDIPEPKASPTIHQDMNCYYRYPPPTSWCDYMRDLLPKSKPDSDAAAFLLHCQVGPSWYLNAQQLLRYAAVGALDTQYGDAKKLESEQDVPLDLSVSNTAKR